MAFIEFRTDRLNLRLLRADDLDAIHAYQRLEEVVRHMLWEIRTLEESRQHLEGRLSRSTLVNDDDSIVIGVELPGEASNQPRLIGEIAVILRSVTNRQAEIGWVLHPDFQGHGYATEAATAVLKWAFAVLGVHRVAAILDPENRASAAVAERIGMQREALFHQNIWFKGAWGDTAVYAAVGDR